MTPVWAGVIFSFAADKPGSRFGYEEETASSPVFRSKKGVMTMVENLNGGYWLKHHSGKQS